MMMGAEKWLVLFAAAILALTGEWFLQTQKILFGLLIYSVLLQSLLLYSAIRWQHLQGRFAVLAIPAIIRLMEYTLPTMGLSMPFVQFLNAVPMALTAIVFVWLFKQGGFEFIIDWRRTPYYLLLMVIGCGVGLILSLFRTPEPLEINFPLMTVFYGFVFLFGAAFLEEWLFRNIMQSAVANPFGNRIAVPIVAYFYSALHLGQGSLSYVLVVFTIACGLGWLRSRSKGLVEVCLVHGIANIMFFLVLS